MRDCDEGRGGAGAPLRVPGEREREGGVCDARGGARGDALDCFGDFGAVGGCEGAFFFHVLGRGGEVG